MAARRPTGAQLEKLSVVCIADVNFTGGDVWSLRLRMAAQAKVRVIVHQQLFIDGTVRVMANRATLAHRLVLKDKGACLGHVTAFTTLVLPSHRQAALRLEDVAPVRIVAIHAIHEAFGDRMMLGQIEFRLDVEMALEAGGRVLAGIDNETSRAARPDVFAARTVTGFASALPRHCRIPNMQPGMGAGGKFADNVRMAIGAGLIPDVVRAGNFKRSHDRGRTGGT